MEASGLGSEDVFRYNQIVTEKLLPRNAITHNAIILFTIELFLKFPEIRRFYNSYFQFLVIDEFQDTNIISWQLVQLIICESTKLLFMGDSLQRIYGFIGACPDIMARASRAYSMEVVTLDKNYRFRNNPDMLKLDNALRRNAECFNSPQVTEEGSLPCCWTLTQKEEATWISQKLIVLLQEDPTCKIAVLVRMRGQCTSIIEDELKQNALPYFHALFNDDDRVYIDFHEKCLMLFRAKHTGRFFSRKKLLDIAKKIEDENSDQSDPVIQSLVSLLYATIEKIATDYAELPAEDRKDMLLDILENHQLKQAMEYIDKPIVLSTLHGAKGLEWDHVILADTEQYVSTGFRSCSLCGQENSYIQQDGLASCKLKLPISQPLQTFLLEDLCLFYVGITRARKQAYISASAQRINSSGREFQNGKIPCFAFLKGVKPYWCNAPTK